MKLTIAQLVESEKDLPEAETTSKLSRKDQNGNQAELQFIELNNPDQAHEVIFLGFPFLAEITQNF